jgi:hypothetical protein
MKKKNNYLYDKERKIRDDSCIQRFALQNNCYVFFSPLSDIFVFQNSKFHSWLVFLPVRVELTATPASSIVMVIVMVTTAASSPSVVVRSEACCTSHSIAYR